jgi:SulP family sulfate permease
MNRSHLTSLRFASAFVDACIRQEYSFQHFRKDLIAGITVGIIAIPLSMALAIACGVPPQNGLYTAIIAGFIIAVTGGARLSISGPTAAFVVILLPVTQEFGLAGLLVATFMAGLILIAMALARLGRLIEYIPESVTLGFTAGIAVVIAGLQLKDFFGVTLFQTSDHFLERLYYLIIALPTLYWPSLMIALATLMTLIIWPKLKAPLPGHLPALVIGVLVSIILSGQGYAVETIASKFSYVLADGTVGFGVPPELPQFIWPWQASGVEGKAFQLSWDMIEALLPAAFSIAMLGAIESLLCAVIMDSKTAHLNQPKHNANGELLGQGLGNLVAPFFGGIPATSALARSAANFKAGAQTPVASMVHALFVLLGLVLLAPLLAYLPMASLAALLIMVAWNMAELPRLKALIGKAPLQDVLTLSTCFALTVLFDMVIAITFGIVMAALLFMKEMSTMTRVSDISHIRKHFPHGLPMDWKAVKINGPLFFAAADRIFAEVDVICEDASGVILYMDGVSILDAGGLANLERFLDDARARNQKVIIADLQFQPLKTLARAKIQPVSGEVQFTSTLNEAATAAFNPW